MMESILMYVTKDGIVMTFSWGVLALMILGMALLFVIFIADEIWSFIQNLIEFRQKKQSRFY